jgi:methionyl-tRNA formyltransferase
MKIVFMGTPGPAAVSLKRLIDEGHEIAAVYTQPDRPAGRGNRINASPVKAVALEHNIRVEQPAKVRTAEALALFKSFDADVAVVVAYGRILPVEWIDAFPHGAINVHFSLLPKYRGAAPVNWAIVNDERETGVTTMKMDAGLDTGPILLQRSTEIDSKETAPKLMERLGILGANLLIDTIDQIDSLSPQSQSEGDATLAPIMKRSDGSIGWELSASEIECRIRGFQPFPSSFAILNGKRVTFFAAKVAPEVTSSAQPGAVVGVSKESIDIQCGNETVLQATEIQLEGKRRMSAQEAFNGRLCSVGDKFDNVLA